MYAIALTQFSAWSMNNSSYILDFFLNSAKCSAYINQITLIVKSSNNPICNQLFYTTSEPCDLSIRRYIYVNHSVDLHVYLSATLLFLFLSLNEKYFIPFQFLSE